MFFLFDLGKFSDVFSFLGLSPSSLYKILEYVDNYF